MITLWGAYTVLYELSVFMIYRALAPTRIKLGRKISLYHEKKKSSQGAHTHNMISMPEQFKIESIYFIKDTTLQKNIFYNLKICGFFIFM